MSVLFDIRRINCPSGCARVCGQIRISRLEHIRKCFTQEGGIFVLEEFNPKTRQIIQRKYKSQMADQICYSVLCLFSYVATGSEYTKKQSQTSSPRPSSAGLGSQHQSPQQQQQRRSSQAEAYPRHH
uniref:MAP kinase-activating death domain-containing protein n=1 Tax=Trichogramma kaykai TaxID=54128 RepID=A0ABD2WEE7_9HYME